jgi:hypothetical protein
MNVDATNPHGSVDIYGDLLGGDKLWEAESFSQICKLPLMNRNKRVGK